MKMAAQVQEKMKMAAQVDQKTKITITSSIFTNTASGSIHLIVCRRRGLDDWLVLLFTLSSTLARFSVTHLHWVREKGLV